ncbi:4a-hydroxytetrahydrobiopterin dehydratase [Pigmentiphaga soli]|uniref:Putative pterin-4-alpha-carbinolamine dehydratase n=1 Tax=Pigmentiphaga soli TaxID=1007095 RepID=A0ABP8HNX9_9BURK
MTDGTVNRILTLDQLRTAHCTRVDGAPLGAAHVQEQLRALPQWTTVRDTLQRSFRFANYYETLAFVNAIAWVVHREDHHPELRVGYDRVEVSFTTHSVKGISINDFICAAKVDMVSGS